MSMRGKGLCGRNVRPLHELTITGRNVVNLVATRCVSDTRVHVGLRGFVRLVLMRASVCSVRSFRIMGDGNVGLIGE